MPGTLTAFCQVPFTSLTTNGWPRSALSVYHPPALQLPAEAHDTEVTAPKIRWVRAVIPGTSMRLCPVPFSPRTTSRAESEELSVSDPPALQLPAEPHDTEVIRA